MAKPASAARCAIYVRKSSEEGLDQAFNSLDAQREACEAYIASQRGEGWRCLPAQYADGGFSGGSLDRPALQRLLADIARGAIDCVVVYKVDRLTRSLTDFARIIEAFDQRGVTFVSVTQAFNTTTSMGRLTLNVLLSFAQFEREVTGERIRDKIAASKRKGMWMGGRPPLGYDIPTDRTVRALVVNPAEAEQVRDIYRRYLRLKAVNAVRDELAREGLRSKAWVTRSGRKMGGTQFNTGSLFHLLQSRVYLGKIVHKDEVHPGVHEAIIDQELFEAVQAQMALNTRQRRVRRERTGSAPLAGKVFDAEGQRMVAAFAYGRAGRRYGYYVSATLQRAIPTSRDMIRRVAARPFEALVLDRLRRFAGAPDADWAELLPSLRRVDVESQTVRLTLASPGGGRTRVLAIRSRLAPSDVLLEREVETLDLTIPVRPVFRGGRTWLVRPEGRSAISQPMPDAGLVKALAQAHETLSETGASPIASRADLLRAKGLPWSYQRRIAPLAFLAPDIQAAILEGRQPAGLATLQMLQQGVPLAWADQRAAFGFEHP